jgi:hypothetical protein
VTVALALLVLGVGASGCGGEGVSKGATVNAYVSAPLCAAAKGELTKQGSSAGNVKLRVVCLAPAMHGGRLDLATIGANARRATEDSSAIAFVEAPGPANRFSRTILEEAGIGWTTASSGASAVQRVLNAVSEAGSGSLRDEVRGDLESESS